METRRWTNPSQPQTLYMATFLLYFAAVLDLIFRFGPLMFVAAVLQGAGAYGIANERRIGYGAAIVGSMLALVPSAIDVVGNPGIILDPMFLIGLVFPVAVFVLLVHPMSRDYQRIWFS
ncbi:MAG: hypothetical protein U0Q07_08945 [Acidimicrobiales bacterium]